MEAGKKGGYGKILELGLEILRWPIEWSCLHYLVELKTPILKLSYSCDASTKKRIIRRQGSSFPANGARSLHLPAIAVDKSIRNNVKGEFASAMA